MKVAVWSMGDGSTVETFYRYAASGERYFKAVGTQTPEYSVLVGGTASGRSATLGVFTGAQGQSLKYWNIVGPSGEVVGRIKTGGVKQWYVKDHLGSTRAVVNDTGAVVEQHDYYPFGLEMSGRGTVDSPALHERYTGHLWDGETGLLYAGARLLDPAIGRWLGVDPLAGDYPSHSPYNYVMGNPLGLIDPTGMAPEVVKASDCPPDCPDSDRDGSGTYAAAAVAVGVLVADDVTAVGILDDILIPVVVVTAVLTNETREAQRTHVTYTTTNPATGEVYVGRASGFGTPVEVVRNRDASHHMTAEGFGPARLDQFANGRIGGAAVRGREQQMIDAFGGARSDPDRRSDSRSANRIRGVSKLNPKGLIYHAAANAAFGNIHPYTGLGNRGSR